MSHYIETDEALPEWAQHRPAPVVASTFRLAPPGCKHPARGCCSKNMNGEIVGRQFPKGTVKITLEEAAALQTYPSDFILPSSQTKGALGLQIGNAVPPLLAQRIFEALWADS